MFIRSPDQDNLIFEAVRRLNLRVPLAGLMVDAGPASATGVPQITLSDLAYSLWAKCPELCDALCGSLGVEAGNGGEKTNFLLALDSLDPLEHENPLIHGLAMHLLLLMVCSLRLDYNGKLTTYSGETVNCRSVARCLGICARQHYGELQPSDLKRTIEENCGKDTRLRRLVASDGGMERLLSWLWSGYCVMAATLFADLVVSVEAEADGEGQLGGPEFEKRLDRGLNPLVFYSSLLFGDDIVGWVVDAAQQMYLYRQLPDGVEPPLAEEPRAEEPVENRFPFETLVSMINATSDTLGKYLRVDQNTGELTVCYNRKGQVTASKILSEATFVEGDGAWLKHLANKLHTDAQPGVTPPFPNLFVRQQRERDGFAHNHNPVHKKVRNVRGPKLAEQAQDRVRVPVRFWSSSGHFLEGVAQVFEGNQALVLGESAVRRLYTPEETLGRELCDMSAEEGARLFVFVGEEPSADVRTEGAPPQYKKRRKGKKGNKKGGGSKTSKRSKVPAGIAPSSVESVKRAPPAQHESASPQPKRKKSARAGSLKKGAKAAALGYAMNVQSALNNLVDAAAAQPVVNVPSAPLLMFRLQALRQAVQKCDILNSVKLAMMTKECCTWMEPLKLAQVVQQLEAPDALEKRLSEQLPLTSASSIYKALSAGSATTVTWPANDDNSPEWTWQVRGTGVKKEAGNLGITIAMELAKRLARVDAKLSLSKNERTILDVRVAGDSMDLAVGNLVRSRIMQVVELMMGLAHRLMPVAPRRRAMQQAWGVLSVAQLRGAQAGEEEPDKQVTEADEVLQEALDGDGDDDRMDDGDKKTFQYEVTNDPMLLEAYALVMRFLCAVLDMNPVDLNRSVKTNTAGVNHKIWRDMGKDSTGAKPMRRQRLLLLGECFDLLNARLCLGFGRCKPVSNGPRRVRVSTSTMLTGTASTGVRETQFGTQLMAAEVTRDDRAAYCAWGEAALMGAGEQREDLKRQLEAAKAQKAEKLKTALTLAQKSGREWQRSDEMLMRLFPAASTLDDGSEVQGFTFDGLTLRFYGQLDMVVGEVALGNSGTWRNTLLCIVERAVGVLRDKEEPTPQEQLVLDQFPEEGDFTTQYLSHKKGKARADWLRSIPRIPAEAAFSAQPVEPMEVDRRRPEGLPDRMTEDLEAANLVRSRVYGLLYGHAWISLFIWKKDDGTPAFNSAFGLDGGHCKVVGGKFAFNFKPNLSYDARTVNITGATYKHRALINWRRDHGRPPFRTRETFRSGASAPGAGADQPQTEPLLEQLLKEWEELCKMRHLRSRRKQEIAERGFLLASVARFREAMRANSEGPIFYGGGFGAGNATGARGARSSHAGTLLRWLAKFFLVIIVPEHYTSQRCPKCWGQLRYSHEVDRRRSKRDIRSKCCQKCPGNDGKDYHDDRDYMAGENILNLFLYAYVLHGDDAHSRDTPKRPLAFQFPSKRRI